MNWTHLVDLTCSNCKAHSDVHVGMRNEDSSWMVRCAACGALHPEVWYQAGQPKSLRPLKETQ